MGNFAFAFIDLKNFKPNEMGGPDSAPLFAASTDRKKTMPASFGWFFWIKSAVGFLKKIAKGVENMPVLTEKERSRLAEYEMVRDEAIDNAYR